MPARLFPRLALVAGTTALLLTACAGSATPASAPTAAALVTVPATGVAVTSPAPTAPATHTAVAPTLAPSPTPGPSLRQLTTGGCCTQPFWSPDGSAVWFIDKPPDLPGGIWAVNPTAPLSATLVTERVGALSPDGALIAYPRGDTTVIERLATGETWDVPAYGRAVAFSPDGQRLAWQVAYDTENFDRRLVQVWVSGLDGSDARQVAELVGGGLQGWMPDSRRLWVTRRSGAGATPEFGILDLETAAFTPLASGDFLRGVSASPDGRWLVYTQQFSGDPERDGIWIQPIEGGAPVKLSVYGAYRWRPDGRLLLIPLEMNAPAQRVVLIDAATGAVQDATDPAVTPLHILDGDWSLAPDGRRLAFVNRDDRNIWLLELPSP